MVQQNDYHMCILCMHTGTPLRNSYYQCWSFTLYSVHLKWKVHFKWTELHFHFTFTSSRNIFIYFYSLHFHFTSLGFLHFVFTSWTFKIKNILTIDWSHWTTHCPSTGAETACWWELSWYDAAAECSGCCWHPHNWRRWRHHLSVIFLTL